MYDTPRELVEALQATPDVLDALLRNVTDQEAREARGGDENWSVVQVMCHLRDAEEFMLNRMRSLRDQPEPQITGFDQEAWAAERDYAAGDLREALAAFKRIRAQHIAELRALTAEQWERQGVHARVGVVTLANHTLHVVWHDAVHAGQIARQLAT